MMEREITQPDNYYVLVANMDNEGKEHIFEKVDGTPLILGKRSKKQKLDIFTHSRYGRDNETIWYFATEGQSGGMIVQGNNLDKVILETKKAIKKYGIASFLETAEGLVKLCGLSPRYGGKDMKGWR